MLSKELLKNEQAQDILVKGNINILENESCECSVTFHLISWEIICGSICSFHVYSMSPDIRLLTDSIILVESD